MTTLPQGKTFLSCNHELICLAYEEASRRGFQADWGHNPEGGYWLEIVGATLEEFGAILKAAEEQAQANGQQLELWDTREPFCCAA